jgi:hypothetical protein
MPPAWSEELLKLWNRLSEVLPGNNEIAKDVIKALVAAALVALITWLAQKLYKWLRRIGGLIWGPDDYRWRVERARSAVDQKGPGLWLAIPIERPREYDDRMNSRPHVLAVANEKGGVSKTTTTANIASAFAHKLQRPVLLLDLDFQGSSGSLMHAGTPWQPQPPHLSAASEAISEQITPSMLARPNGFAREFTWADNRGVVRHRSSLRQRWSRRGAAPLRRAAINNEIVSTTADGFRGAGPAEEKLLAVLDHNATASRCASFDVDDLDPIRVLAGRIFL